MEQALQAGALIEPAEHESFAERWAGLLISVFLHLMIFALALRLSIAPPPPKPPDPEPTTLLLSIAPGLMEAPEAPEPEAPEVEVPIPEPEPEPEPIPPPPPQFIEVMRTSSIGEELADEAHDSSDFEEIGNPEAEPLPDAESLPAPSELEEATETADEAQVHVSEATRRLMERQSEVAQATIQQHLVTETQIQGRLYAERERLSTRNADYDSEGAATGQIRELDFSDVPLTIARTVLQRYGGEIEHRVLRPGEERNTGPITLNAARIGDQVLTAQERSEGGEALIMSAGPELIAYMQYLESLELARRGLNPGETAITRSVFGAAMGTNGWALELKDIQYVEVE